MRYLKPLFLTTAVVIAGTLGSLTLLAWPQARVRGTITGTVTADRGNVIGLRVTAHNLDLRLWYIVFTNKGRYTIPQALPGRYEVTVNEEGYEASTVTLPLTAADTRTANVTLKPKSVAATQAADEMLPANRRGNVAKRIVYVDSMEEIFPPGPGQDLVRSLCTGCHRDGGTWRNAQTYDDFLKGIERMTETGPAGFPNVLALGRTPLSAKEKALIAEYLTKHFGPGVPDRRLRIDPLVVNEEIASKSIYVAYDLPEDLPLEPSQGRQVGAPMIDGEFPQLPGLAFHHLQAAALAPDGSVWFSSRVSNSVIRLDPKEHDPVKRWTDYPIKGDRWVAVSGMAVDSKGKVYWSELKGGMLGELDPVTGKQTRYVIPQQGVDVGLTVDQDDNVCFALIWGALFGRLDAKTRTIHTYPTPTPDNGIYGLASDRRGNLWGAGWQKGTIAKWDAETQLVKEYPVPNAWGQIRRMGVDSKGMVWGSEYNVGMMVRLDPQTGQLTEYKIPVSGAIPYEAWPDRDDKIWSADEVHSTLLKLDPATGKYTFYPMPQPHQSVPKIEVEANNTMWFGSRGVPHVVAVHFYPDGYTAVAPPLP